MGVIELKEPALDPQHGLPHYYLVIHDQVALDHTSTTISSAPGTRRRRGSRQLLAIAGPVPPVFAFDAVWR